jgi:hypothetical protein
MIPRRAAWRGDCGRLFQQPARYSYDSHSPQALILPLLGRALAEPVFRELLVADPLGVAVAAGVRPSAAELKQLFGTPEASDVEFIEMLAARLRATPACCGCSG